MSTEKHQYYLTNWGMRMHLNQGLGSGQSVYAGTLICPSNEKLHKRTVVKSSTTESYVVVKVRFYFQDSEDEFISGKEFESYYNLTPVNPKEVNWIIE